MINDNLEYKPSNVSKHVILHAKFPSFLGGKQKRSTKIMKEYNSFQLLHNSERNDFKLIYKNAPQSSVKKQWNFHQRFIFSVYFCLQLFLCFSTDSFFFLYSFLFTHSLHYISSFCSFLRELTLSELNNVWIIHGFLSAPINHFNACLHTFIS